MKEEEFKLRNLRLWLVILFYVGFQWTGAMKNGSMTFFCQWVLDNSFFTRLGLVENLGDAWGPSPWHWPPQ